MTLAPRLEARQTQTLAMTPQLQQAIKLLQMGNAELKEFVEQQVQENPLLEMAAADDGRIREVLESADIAATLENTDFSRIDTAALASSDTLPTGGEALDIADSTLWDASSDIPAVDTTPWAVHHGGDGNFPDWEEQATGEETLFAHLEKQIGLAIADATRRAIALYLADQLDEAGYLRVPLEDCAAALGCTLAEVEEVLGVLQTLEPAGVFARNLRECLALQLKDKHRLDPGMRVLLDNLELLGKGQLNTLQKLCKADAEDFASMLADIKSLDPKPGARFAWKEPESLIPDVLAKPRGGGSWQVELNPETLPNVLVHQHYSRTVLGDKASKQDRQYLQQCQQAADWLTRALNQRATTMLNVAIAIVEKQQPFFRHGVRFLQPLVLRDLAGSLGVHESTVSRIVNNKYIATPRGTFELKYFLTSGAGVTGAFGDTVSSQAVKHRIATLVQKENPKKPLSDEQLATTLKLEGIDIARRTVAKYREAMGIKGSSERKR